MSSVSATKFLPYGRQDLHEDDVAAVIAVLRGDYWTTGPTVAEFEQAFAAQCKAKHAIAVANGTAALHLAAIAAGLGPGGLAMVPDITFAATANAARYVGADVLFCDVDPDSGLMTPDTLAVAITCAQRKIDCIFPVHYAGQAVDVDSLRRVCSEFAFSKDAIFVEDACHAIGTDTSSRGRVGSCLGSSMTAFSFHPVKTVAAGEGGMITTNDDGLAHRLRLLRSHGITRGAQEFVCSERARAANGATNSWYYEVAELGFNYRLSDIHSALGLSQLRRLEAVKRERANLAKVYDQLLRPLAPVVVPLARVADCDPCWHLYVVLIDFDALGSERQSVVEALRRNGIGTQVHYIPLDLQPSFSANNEKHSAVPDFSGAHKFYSRCLSLPLFVGMADGDVVRVVECLQKIIDNPPLEAH